MSRRSRRELETILPPSRRKGEPEWHHIPTVEMQTHCFILQIRPLFKSVQAHFGPDRSCIQGAHEGADSSRWRGSISYP